MSASPSGWADAPVFGRPPAAGTPVIRPSVYALISDPSGRVAVVRSVEGFFLPGGGIEAGETPEAALRREALEECGFDVTPGSWTIRAVQFAHSLSARADLEKRSLFVECVVAGPAGPPREPDHALFWEEPSAAAALLAHESHRWAIEEWVRLRAARRPFPVTGQPVSR